jgi:hypothetical protein
MVKEVKLPSFSFTTHQMNQYNRKRIIQSKIKYDPIEISFHDDTGNQINKMWEAYYTYYYNDGAKPGALTGNRGSIVALNQGGASYNERNVYQASITGNDDWGFIGGATARSGSKSPFFKNITVFGFDQHKYTAYTLINPVITAFSHDTYNYAEGNGVMQNRMTIDYETVVYNYGPMDGNDPSNIVTGFGEQAHYDRRLSPIALPGSNSNFVGPGGLIAAAGGAVQQLSEGNILGAIRTAGAAYNTVKNTNLVESAKLELSAMLINAVQNTPNLRNTLFNVPTAQSSPGPAGLAAAPPVGALPGPSNVDSPPTAGTQNAGIDIY